MQLNILFVELTTLSLWNCIIIYSSLVIPVKGLADVVLLGPETLNSEDRP